MRTDPPNPILSENSKVAEIFIKGGIIYLHYYENFKYRREHFPLFTEIAMC
jgi:hypothetical protein